MPKCFFAAPRRQPCAGPLQRAHVIKAQTLRRELKHWTECPSCHRQYPGAEFCAHAPYYRPRHQPAGLGAGKPRASESQEYKCQPVDIEAIIWSPAVWVVACESHHRAHDHAGVGRIGVLRRELPDGVERFAEQYGLVWYLDRNFGSAA